MKAILLIKDIYTVKPVLSSLKQPLKKTKIGFNTDYCLMEVKSIPLKTYAANSIAHILCVGKQGTLPGSCLSTIYNFDYFIKVICDI